MQTRTASILALFVGAAFASAAAADTVTAQFTSSLSQSANVSLSGVYNGNVTTVLFDWARTDTPGPGVDSTIDPHFNSYCIDLAQRVRSNTNYTFEVLTPAEHGWTAMQEIMMGRLWSSYFDDIDTSTETAAFQVAVWEIAYDSGVDLGSGDFEINASSSATGLAQTWLNDVASNIYRGGQWQVSILFSEGSQDQVVPAPGAAALLGLTGFLAARRRR